MPASHRSPARPTARAGRASPDRASDTREPSEARALLDALRAVSRELRLAERRGDAVLSLQPAQRHALRELATHPASSLAELAERTHTDPSSASVVVQRLVERGLVSRGEAAADRRRTVLRVTAAGRALAGRAPASAVERVEGALAALGQRRAASLAAGLQKLARGLHAAHDGDAAVPGWAPGAAAR